MPRITFRLLLPVVFVVVHTALVWVAATQQPNARASALYLPQRRPVAYQEGGGTMTLDPEPPPLKPVQRIALVLDLPIFILAAPLAASLFPRNEMAVFHLSTPLVPLLWYGIGRWLDGMLGYIQRLRLHGTLRRLIGIPAAGLLCVSAAILTPLYRHRTVDSYWVGAGMMLWSGLALAIALSTKPETARTISQRD